MDYVPPTPADLQALKTQLGYTGKQMAALTCVGEQHWRKYTGGADPKDMPFPNLFHLAARLALDEGELKRVYSKVREIGGEFDPDGVDPKLVELGAATQAALDHYTCLYDKHIDAMRELQYSDWTSEHWKHKLDELHPLMQDARAAYDAALEQYRAVGGRRGFHSYSRHSPHG